MREGVIVVGAGPAGTAAAAACAEAGLPVTLVAPDLGSPWPNTFGVWEDELTGLGLGGVASQRWPRPLVGLDGGYRALDRPYLLLDNEGLRSRLRERMSGARLVPAGVATARHDEEGSVVTLTDGRALGAAVVVDASGHRPALVRTGHGRAPAFQTAYGVIARCNRPLAPPESMVLMDWRSVRGAAGPPTFLYAMDLGDGRWLLEETSLAARPAAALPLLRERLWARVGGRIDECLGEERVCFPMGAPLPPRDQRVVAFGSAAGMVHPATGYQVATALRRAPALASALADATAQGAGPVERVHAAWEAVWPADLRRQHALHRLGLETLLRLDQAQLGEFFAAFFALPPHRWRGYLSGEPSAVALARTMLGLFARAPRGVRAIMLRTPVDLALRRV